MKKQLPIANAKAHQTLMRNAEYSIFRSDLLRKLLDPRIDMNYECGYPDKVSAADYHEMYEREGIARRTVGVYPKECWAMNPTIYEQEEPQDTEFENAVNALVQRRMLWHFMERVDILSGIGRFGILLLGLNDGQDLAMPAAGINVRGEPEGSPKTELLYLRAFDESVVTIASSEPDKTNPRYGFPLMYNVNYFDETTGISVTGAVHWSRVIHIADNRSMSEIYGTPRMLPVYNRLLDVRKILSGSGEMFWKGAFPGYSLEVNPDQRDVELDADALREEFQNYQMGLQRYLALTGVSAKSLSPQVADPRGHIEAHMENIAITLNIPKRILWGSERGELSSGQDAKAWNKRLAGRQSGYLNPMVLEPVITRLIYLGVLPETKEKTEWGTPVFTIDWPDMNTVTDQEKAGVAVTKTDALAKYVAGGVNQLVPPMEFYTQIMGMTEEEAEALVDAGEAQALEQNEEIPEGEDSEAVSSEEDEEVVVDDTKNGKPVRNSQGAAKPIRPFVGNGGAGSGNFRHSGRPGEIGGLGGGSVPQTKTKTIQISTSDAKKLSSRFSRGNQQEALQSAAKASISSGQPRYVYATRSGLQIVDSAPDLPKGEKYIRVTAQKNESGYAIILDDFERPFRDEGNSIA